MIDMASGLDRELNRYLKQLNDAEKKSVLLMLKTFLQGRGEDIGIEQYNLELDKAMEEVNSGKVYAHEAVKDMSKDW